MIRHVDLGDSAFSRAKALKLSIDAGKVSIGGNRKLNIYGKLSCTSGKRMNEENRVFFADESEAKDNNYRPCGHCMREAYQKWKALN
ncbi:MULTISPECIES: Ada metal-binding domain-containing protein [unclassified Mucilaginibacter]|uniref:Ada metal-binding domain-containing protein n=1 Tax=unclassified Mucilaginibacter TaxID=2617802 RepID=UPI002AC972B5|nr:MULTISPECIES: Ada metal-binding domain-containing protein [unclassified Mucilaginibacter]MEB0249468.1 Ada metal-binding domain-containing protein [Mucilaginibacter sp. 5B2]MEB0260606.1 Ada metal-binding domain-containing protein [Mucilaginibacter sp. 10I4]MEB0278038.1 Ada metal-binding domain-containing protein [Mucilaginibacter sp. 10B2]MEB0299608.1 Ada metal-binding domain-containing protein [Mucilaginibacter sp. 5C4]WPX22927.1 Ada metal-binding domain-containing protein [Mucilaginibacter